MSIKSQEFDPEDYNAYSDDEDLPEEEEDDSGEDEQLYFTFEAAGEKTYFVVRDADGNLVSKHPLVKKPKPEKKPAPMKKIPAKKPAKSLKQ
jgi:hypothetical protein